MIRYIVLSYRIHHGFTRFGQQNLSLEPPNTVATTNPVRGIFFESKKKKNLFLFRCILVSGDVDHRLSFLENTQQRRKLWQRSEEWDDKRNISRVDIHSEMPLKPDIPYQLMFKSLEDNCLGIISFITLTFSCPGLARQSERYDQAGGRAGCVGATHYLLKLLKENSDNGLTAVLVISWRHNGIKCSKLWIFWYWGRKLEQDDVCLDVNWSIVGSRKVNINIKLTLERIFGSTADRRSASLTSNQRKHQTGYLGRNKNESWKYFSIVSPVEVMLYIWDEIRDVSELWLTLTLGQSWELIVSPASH